jgi:hypothetical protein
MYDQQNDRAKYFRERAVEAREKAQTMMDRETCQIILDVAGMWDRLADREEKKTKAPSN